MHYTARATLIVAALASVAAADVTVGINIGLPPPPAIVVPAPPRLVIVPTTPAVRYAPDLDVNFFVYGGRYYTIHDDHWFVARAYNGPWTYVERADVPRAVLVVPARYYRGRHGHPHGMPPGQAKKYYRSVGWDHGHHHGHKHHDD